MKKAISPRVIPALLAVAFSGGANAAAFQLLEQNASGQGNAYAGSAAVASDASTIFFNPAGMTYLPGMQLVAAVNVISLHAKFSNDGSTLPSRITNAGGDGGEAGGAGVVPSFYLALPINDRWSVGLGVNAPFGLKTEYDDDWMGRFHAIKSDVKTINVNPSVAYKVNDAVSLGFGLNWQRIDATLTSAANVSAGVCANAALAVPCGLNLLNNLESTARVEGDDDSWGYNLGAIFKLSEATRVGVAYRSSIKYKVTGTIALANPTVTAASLSALGGAAAATAAAVNAGIAANAALKNGDVKLDVKLPDIFTVSGRHQLNDRWELLGDISWTGWSKISKLDIVRTSGTLAGQVASHTQENWRDTWRVAIGANYQLNDAWKLRVGTAFDQSPVDADTYRTPRLPDINRYWLSFGAQYKISKSGAIDMGYSHLFMEKSKIHNDGQGADTASKGLVDGSYKSSVDILAVQYTHTF